MTPSASPPPQTTAHSVSHSSPSASTTKHPPSKFLPTPSPATPSLPPLHRHQHLHPRPQRASASTPSSQATPPAPSASTYLKNPAWRRRLTKSFSRRPRIGGSGQRMSLARHGAGRRTRRTKHWERSRVMGRPRQQSLVRSEADSYCGGFSPPVSFRRSSFLFLCYIIHLAKKAFLCRTGARSAGV